ncbi:MAG: hypothetical protein ACRBF0_13905 [Calditrichia bacterium]
MVTKIVEWVIQVVGEWLVELVCRIVIEVVRIVVMTIVRVSKWVVDFIICLPTDPLSALKSITDLWFIATDVIEDVLDLAVEIVDAVSELLDITEEFFVDLGSSFGIIGLFVASLIKWVFNVFEGLVDLTRNVIEILQNLVLGVLRLDPCGLIKAGSSAVGAIARTISITGQRIGGGFLGSARDILELDQIEAIIEAAISQTFKDENLREMARENIQLGSTRLGLSIAPNLMRMSINSRQDNIDLRALHQEKILNLFQAAGYTTGCGNGILNHPATEVVYRGTNVRVTWRDLDAYLSYGRESVAEFEIFAISKQVFNRYYKLAQRKARTLGLRLENVPIEAYRVRFSDEIPVDRLNQTRLFQRIGRNANGDDLCKPPVIAIFKYSDNAFNGNASWWRPPVSVQESGVTFKDRQPVYMFRWVLIHELGHYFGLDHLGHSGVEQIMFTSKDSDLDPVTEKSILELVFFTGEPRFIIEDTRIVWTWLTHNAPLCILGQE